MLAQTRDLAQNPAILTFTGEGCQLAKNIGLKTSQNNNECTATARFDEHRLGGGGSIRLDDDRVVMISSALLLAWQPAVDVRISDTPAQKNAMLRYWIFMLLALSFIVISLELAFGKPKKSTKETPGK
jgi:hypothetical protein